MTSYPIAFQNAGGELSRIVVIVHHQHGGLSPPFGQKERGDENVARPASLLKSTELLWKGEGSMPSLRSVTSAFCLT